MKRQITDQERARMNGWRVEEDGWWTRNLRLGDNPITDSAIGFSVTDVAGDEVVGHYVRSAAFAVAYDAGQPTTELTPIGEQFVIPGCEKVEPVSDQPLQLGLWK